MRLRLIHSRDLKDSKRFMLLSWEDFCSRFDLLGLSCVYDDDSTGYNELLQIEGKSPYRNEKYGVQRLSN